VRVISRRTNYLLLLGVILLVLIPLVFVHGEFGGTDDAGSAAVAAAVPGFKPWFQPIWVPPSPEIESLLFAVQAAFGAGIIGYVLGRIQGAASARDAQKKSKPGNVAH
jgi:cobalt/nickel transport protein